MQAKSASLVYARRDRKNDSRGRLSPLRPRETGEEFILKKTTDYELNQWEKTDRILMDDFNADNAKIEQALAGLNNQHLVQLRCAEFAKGATGFSGIEFDLSDFDQTQWTALLLEVGANVNGNLYLHLNDSSSLESHCYYSYSSDNVIVHNTVKNSLATIYNRTGTLIVMVLGHALVSTVPVFAISPTIAYGSMYPGSAGVKKLTLTASSTPLTFSQASHIALWGVR
ncbi:hypothetical protein OBV_43560 [Oscillibacter valericigenes Sjm18-20]|nr:hypothetical protein OBV_43560 [Oscillibacter valericigenes Sjm18-20]